MTAAFYKCVIRELIFIDHITFMTVRLFLAQKTLAFKGGTGRIFSKFHMA